MISREQLKALVAPEKGLVLFFDNDMSGKKACKTVAQEIKSRDVKVPVYRVTDFSGCSDVDQIITKAGKDGIIKALQSLDKIL
jgi:DNA primase